MAESSGESLNIVEDFTEFLGEYETTTSTCFDNTKKVLANIMNKSSFIDFDKYIGIHLKKLQSSLDYLTAKNQQYEESFEGHDPVMGQSMQNRFEKDSVNAPMPKFSSSMGFRDMPPKQRNNMHLRVRRQSPGQRSTSYSRWTKGTEDGHQKSSNALDDYYKTNDAVNN